MRAELPIDMCGTRIDANQGKIRRQGDLFSEEADFSMLPGQAEGEDSQPTLFTIGHSTRKIEEFVAVLERYGVERLVDIRHFPSSRHNPQFNQPELREALETRGVEYIWLKELGGYREGGYLAYMQTVDFSAGLSRLDVLAREKPTACMCAELKWYQCHRRRVADVLSDRGWRVVHILDASRAEAHRLKTNRIKCD
jgi:uncharacterized protein (DUF488 family)